MSNKGTLFLIPNSIAENTQDVVIGPHVRDHLPKIRHFLAEDARNARRYLSSLKIYPSIEELSFSVLDKHTTEEELEELFKPLTEGHHLGVLSDSGCPGIADPGALAARYAHRHGFSVRPLTGPSSLVLALMGSGLNGQHFAFHGYLPIESKEAAKLIRDLEKESRAKNQTQIFIETPYRNNAIFQNLLKTLHEQTLLCVAIDLTGSQERLETKTVKHWRAQTVEWPRQPAVFLFLA